VPKKKPKKSSLRIGSPSQADETFEAGTSCDRDLAYSDRVSVGVN